MAKKLHFTFYMVLKRGFMDPFQDPFIIMEIVGLTISNAFHVVFPQQYTIPCLFDWDVSL
jgi:hypothetical protein